LLEDPDFLEQLEKVEINDIPSAPGSPWYQARVGYLNSPMLLSDDVLVHDVDVTRWTAIRPGDVADVVVEDERWGSSRGRIALALGGFLLLMCVGAGAAAMVFHDRLALILR
jgi:hypothetical protein